MTQNINITRHTHNIEISEPMRDYHLPIASDTVLGGIKVGSNLSITSEGVLSANPGSYELPTASSSTLGGIKVGENLSISDSGVLTADVDSTLSSASSATNPVQNKVIASALNAINSTTDILDDRLDTAESDISDLQSAGESVSSALDEITDDISTMQDNISTNTSNISDNATAIDTVSGNLGSLSTTVDNLSGTVTDQGNAIDTMGAQVADVIISSDTDVTYSYLLPINTWTQGKIIYSRRGKIGLVTFDLIGNMNLDAGNETQIYQLPDTFQNSILCKGMLNTNIGPISVLIDANRNISFKNVTASNMNQITKVSGQLVVVLE